MTAQQLQQINEGNHKCIRVIDSCKTLDQLANADKYASIFLQNIIRPPLDKMSLFDKELKPYIKLAIGIENKLLELLKLKKVQLKKTSK